MATLESPISPPTSVTPSLGSARAALAAAARDYLAVPDGRLEAGWIWRGRELDVRYGLYRAFETIEAATVGLDGLASGSVATPSEAVRRIRLATAARWALQGRLAILDEGILDTVARDGEWTVRETLAHVIAGQRSYGWFTRWWLSRSPDEPLPDRIPDDVERASEAELPPEPDEGDGSLDDIRARLDDVLDDWALRLANVPDAALATPALWWGNRVTVGFRLSRWSSHIVEHAIQVDKTLAWLGVTPTEVHRTVRAIHEAWGALETRVFPVTPDGAGPILAGAAETLVAQAASTRAAAG